MSTGTIAEGGSISTRWRELIDELHALVPDLAAQYVGRVRAVPGYEPESSGVGDEELRETAVTCIGLLIESIRDGHGGDRLDAAAGDLGRRRAFQRVPAESVAIALQLDFGVIWGGLLEICGPRDAVVLTAQVEPTWRIIDRFTAAVMSSYNSETSRLAQHETNLRQATIGRLFAVPHESLARTVAFQIGCDAADHFTVVVADQSDSQDRLAAAVERLPRSAPVFTHRFSGATVVFWPSSAGDAAIALEEIRASRARGVRGLAAVPGTARTLLGVLDATDALRQQIVDLEHSIPLLARRALIDQKVDLRPVVADRWASCPPYERDRIVETLEEYFATGSVQRTAQRLFCHRNTVLNRLSRFTELTGLDVTIPRDAATAMIALDHP
ncbi:PucR family transcriptional regulator [Microbacterium sp.]|uniref:PucR family transcriptional regulator n=1 Tax=Microbacterium sp. TaxID=51671 RepID=UPI0039E51BC3